MLSESQKISVCPTLDGERWGVYPFDTDYCVSTLGRIASFKRYKTKGTKVGGKAYILNTGRYYATIAGQSLCVVDMIGQTFIDKNATYLRKHLSEPTLQNIYSRI